MIKNRNGVMVFGQKDRTFRGRGNTAAPSILPEKFHPVAEATTQPLTSADVAVGLPKDEVVKGD